MSLQPAVHEAKQELVEEIRSLSDAMLDGHRNAAGTNQLLHLAWLMNCRRMKNSPSVNCLTVGETLGIRRSGNPNTIGTITTVA